VEETHSFISTGPKGLSILGNVLDLPPNVPFWESLASWANRHGTLPIYSVLRQFWGHLLKGTDILYVRLLDKTCNHKQRADNMGTANHPSPAICLISSGLSLFACPGYHTFHPFNYHYL